MHVKWSLLTRGRYFTDNYLCDKDPITCRVSLAAFQHTFLIRQFLQACLRRNSLWKAFRSYPIGRRLDRPVPSGQDVNLVVQSLDYQPLSMAGNQLFFKDTRSSSFHHSLHVIRQLHELTRSPLSRHH